MTLKECYAALHLQDGADMEEVKKAYRKLAFSLHPDLNPKVPDAARQFQRLNEAYVQLSQYYAGRSGGSASGGRRADEAGARAREEAQKAYAKARREQGKGMSGTRGEEPPSAKEEILKDILNDPFARRVFEDIYSHIRRERPGGRGEEAANVPKAPPRPGAAAKKKAAPARKTAPAVKKQPPTLGGAVVSKVKGWLRKQIDDEQVLHLPGESLVPGARVRLQIRHGFSGEPEIVELTLPPEFVPGKAMRLKGMGRRLGSLRGDLYVRIEPA